MDASGVWITATMGKAFARRRAMHLSIWRLTVRYKADRQVHYRCEPSYTQRTQLTGTYQEYPARITRCAANKLHGLQNLNIH